MRTFNTEENIALINEHLQTLPIGATFTAQGLKDELNLQPSVQWIGRTISCDVKRKVTWTFGPNNRKVFKLID